MPLSSAFSKNSPGNFTQRGANLGYSLPVPQGSNLAGSLSFMGKTTLFSRVALSPSAAKGGVDKKESSIAMPIQKAAPQSDFDTNASTQAGGGALGKTVRSSTTTSTFKDAIQRGVLSGAGILKK